MSYRAFDHAEFDEMQEVTEVTGVLRAAWDKYAGNFAPSADIRVSPTFFRLSAKRTRCRFTDIQSRGQFRTFGGKVVAAGAVTGWKSGEMAKFKELLQET